MTNEHIIKKEMINQGIKINIYYDNEEKVKEIELNTDERFIKDFTDIIEEKNIDATVIQILPTDKIDTKLFLIPSINYMYKYDNLIDKEVTSFDVKHFNYTVVVNSNEWEKRHSDGISSDYFNLFKFLTYLIEKPKPKEGKKLLLKELLIKILITIVFNSNQQFTDETFKKIYKHYIIPIIIKFISYFI